MLTKIVKRHTISYLTNCLAKSNMSVFATRHNTASINLEGKYLTIAL